MTKSELMKKSTFFTIVIQINHINKFYYTEKVESLMLFPRTRWIPRQRTMTLRVMWHENVHLVVCVRTSLCKVRNSIFRVWITWKVKCGNWKMLSQRHYYGCAIRLRVSKVRRISILPILVIRKLVSIKRLIRVSSRLESQICSASSWSVWSSSPCKGR